MDIIVSGAAPPQNGVSNNGQSESPVPKRQKNEEGIIDTEMVESRTNGHELSAMVLSAAGIHPPSVRRAGVSASKSGLNRLHMVENHVQERISVEVKGHLSLHRDLWKAKRTVEKLQLLKEKGQVASSCNFHTVEIKTRDLGTNTIYQKEMDKLVRQAQLQAHDLILAAQKETLAKQELDAQLAKQSSVKSINSYIDELLPKAQLNEDAKSTAFYLKRDAEAAFDLQLATAFSVMKQQENGKRKEKAIPTATSPAQPQAHEAAPKPPQSTDPAQPGPSTSAGHAAEPGPAPGSKAPVSHQQGPGTKGKAKGNSGDKGKVKQPVQEQHGQQHPKKTTYRDATDPKPRSNAHGSDSDRQQSEIPSGDIPQLVQVIVTVLQQMNLIRAPKKSREGGSKGPPPGAGRRGKGGGGRSFTRS